MKLLTNLLFEPKGKHDPALTYSIKDTVMSPDGSQVYFALRDVPAGIALNDERYWKLQIDLSGSKHAMDEVVANFSDYARIVGTRVRGETAKASGNPVTFLPDAGSLLQPVTVLEPQQSGSGEPYPAGGGKNLIPYPFTVLELVPDGVTFTDNGDGTITANGTAGSSTTYALCSGEFLFKVGKTYIATDVTILFAGVRRIQPGVAFTVTDADLSASVIKVEIRPAAGTVFTNTVLKPQIELGSTATSYAPYSNIRPFIGYDAVELNHAGKNLLPNTATTQTVNGVTFTVSTDGSIAVNGTATDTVFFNIGRVMLESGVAYTLSGCPAGGNNGGNFLMYINIGSEFYYDFGSSVSFEGTGETRAVLIQVKSGATVNATFYPMIRLASDLNAAFESYQGNTCTVQIGQTVYGIRYEWLTGKGVIEWTAVNMSHESVWSSISTIGDYTRAVLYDVLKDAAGPEVALTADGLCSHAEYVTDWVKQSTHVYAFDTNIVAIFPTSLVGTTSDSINAWIAGQENAGTPVQIAYKLATPVEIQLTPHVISAVEPEQTNTLYGDGSIDVEYVKPLHVSIEERVAAALAAAMNTEGE